MNISAIVYNMESVDFEEIHVFKNQIVVYFKDFKLNNSVFNILAAACVKYDCCFDVYHVDNLLAVRFVTKK